MKVKDIMTLLESPDRVRIIKDNEEVYNRYFANMAVDEEAIKRFGDMEVKRFRVIPEIRHKNWKSLNLMPPLKPEETPDYSFSDLQLSLYRTIWI